MFPFYLGSYGLSFVVVEHGIHVLLHKTYYMIILWSMVLVLTYLLCLPRSATAERPH